MTNKKLLRYAKLVLLAGGLPAIVFSVGISLSGTVHALTSTSTHYQVDSTQFGSGSTSQTCSTNFCANGGIGTVTAGETNNTTNSANLGQTTENGPSLDVSVDGGASDLGVLTTEQTATKITVVKIRSYLSGGYILQIIGSPPTYAGHTLSTPSTPTPSYAGVEQFGINAVANTTPAVGANVLQVPSIQTSFGAVNANYATANLFMYNSGDVVAHSPTASGETDFTVSMILNISNVTPAGHYSGDFSAVVIPVF